MREGFSKPFCLCLSLSASVGLGIAQSKGSVIGALLMLVLALGAFVYAIHGVKWQPKDDNS